MNRRKLLGRFGNSKKANSADRLDYFKATLEPLEKRELLTAVTWTIVQSLSAITIKIPDQNISVGGFDLTAQLRNPNGSSPWTTNSSQASGTITTDYTDTVSIDFNAGANAITAVPIYNVRPNPAAYVNLGGTSGLFTNTSTAPAALGARVNATGFEAGYLALNNMTYDLSSDPSPITGTTFPIAGNNFNISTLSGTALVDGVSIFLVGQQIPDTVLVLTDPFGGTNNATLGTVINTGGLNRQMTIPFFIAAELEFSGQTLNGTILGQMVATATIPNPNAPPVLDLGNNPDYATTWNFAPVATENTGTASLTDDSGTLASMTVTLSSHPGDVLTANTSGTGIGQSWDGTNLVLTGTDTAANYQAVLRTIQYNNTSGGPGVASETATFTAVDGNGATDSAVATITITANSTVNNRFLFYRFSSRYDTTGGPRSPLAYSHDNAIATDKSAYIANGTTANFGNYSSYALGVNGIDVDLLGGGQHGSITASDFTIKVGNNTSYGTWAAGPTPTVTVRTGMTGSAQGAGTVSGSDRVELTWANNAIQQQWVEVIVKANNNTGLAANSVFFFGSEIGNTAVSNSATVARTTASDVTGVQTHGAILTANIPITNIYDFDRDGRVNANDVTQAQTHGTSVTNGLKLIAVPSTGPFAPDALPSASPALSLPGGLSGLIPSSILNKLGDLASSTGPLAKYLTRLAHEGTAHAQQLLDQASGLAHLLGINTSFIDSLIAKISNVLPSASPGLSLPGGLSGLIPSSILNKLGDLASSTGPLAKYLTRLAHEGTGNAQQLLSQASSLAHLLGINTSFVDGLLAKIANSLPSASPTLSLPSIPPALLNRLGNLHLDLNGGPIGKYFEKLAHEATENAKKILKIADDVADFLHLDHALLDSLLARLGIDD